MNEVRCPQPACERLVTLEKRVGRMENSLNVHNVMFAKINVKLNGILWGVGAVATAVIGVLVKLAWGG